MQLVYAGFLISPYYQRIARAVKKEKKAYFYDWGPRRLSRRNDSRDYVAVELAAMIDLWHDKGIGDFELMYVRTRAGKESDFLIIRDRRPWCLFEAKVQDDVIAPAPFSIKRMPWGISRLSRSSVSDKVFKRQDSRFFRVSASRLFSDFFPRHREGRADSASPIT